MSGLDRASASDNSDGSGRQPPPGSPQFEGYPRPATAGDRSFRQAGSDITRAGSDNGAEQGNGLSPEQLNFLSSWSAREKQIEATNDRIGKQENNDGGAHLQNGVYELTKQVLKEQGLDKAGWAAYPVGMHSPLDDIGADIVLVNSRTGAMVFMDPSSRRLDPRTGERAAAGASAKENVPAIREPGVVDALPRWFDRGTLRLDTDQDDPTMRARVADFQRDFRAQISDLTSSPAPFNLKDFPLPYYGQMENPGEKAGLIKPVIDWSRNQASQAARQGDRGRAQLLNDYADAVTGALNFNRREGSANLQVSVDKTVDRVIADEALRRAYPDLAGPLPPNQNKFQRLDDGSTIQVDKSNVLVLKLKAKGPGSKPGEEQIITAGSVTDSFAKHTTYWAGGQYDTQKQAEFKALLPAKVQKMIDAGQVNLGKILAAVGDNRNVFAGGGAGVDKPLVARVVTRLATRKADGLRQVIDEGEPQSVARPAVVAAEAARENVTSINGARPKVAPADAARERVATAGAAAESTVRVRPGGNGVQTPETNLGRPKPDAAGVRWEPGRAPAPVVGKVDLPPAAGSPQAKPEGRNGAGPEVKPGADQVGSAASQSKGDAPLTDHLTPDEVHVLQWARADIEKKGAANMTADERQMVNSIKFAERELARPFGNDPVRTSLVGRIREMLGTDARGPMVTAAMLAGILVNFYASSKDGTPDQSRAKFY